MTKSKKDTTTMTKSSDLDPKRCTSSRQSIKNTGTIVEKLRQQSPTPALKRFRNGSSKTSEPAKKSYVQSSTMLQRNTSESSSDSTPVSLFQVEMQDNNDNESVDTEAADNLQKKLQYTRVDLKIKVNAHMNPKEQTVHTLQTFLRKLQFYDSKAKFAPWYDDSVAAPLAHSSDITPRPTQLEKYFPRIFFKEEGFTWYSGAKIIHSLPIQDLRKDMIRWMKKEGHGIFERMLQVADTSEVGWLVNSTWQMDDEISSYCDDN